MTDRKRRVLITRSLEEVTFASALTSIRQNLSAFLYRMILCNPLQITTRLPGARRGIFYVQNFASQRGEPIRAVQQN